MALIKTLTGLVFATVAFASSGIKIYTKGELAYDTCNYLIKDTVFYFDSWYVGMTEVGENGGWCNKDLQQALGSMTHCLVLMEIPSGITFFLESCAAYNVTMEDFDEAYENATSYLITDTSSLNNSYNFYYPITIEKTKLEVGYESYTNRRYNYNRANFYGAALISYWFLLIFFAGLLRLIKAMAPKKVNSFNGKLANAYKRYVSMPALGTQKVVTRGKMFKVIEFAIPTRMETIYLVAWFAMALAFNVANFHHVEGNIFWSTRSTEFGREVSDRTGIMVMYLIPQLFLFAGRNNFLQWVSGWSFTRFNIIHRWMARVALILMVVHGITMTINSVGINYFDERNKEVFVQWGYVAVIIGGIMCFHSLMLLRKNNYELFVLSHNILGIVFVASTWIHVAVDGFQQLMYATTAVWAFDKFMRLVRIAWFGIKTAEVQLIADETLKVKVPRPSSWKPYPLCFSYIYFFKVSCFWQSHPFTVVDSVTEEDVICFYIKVKGGMSNSLYQFLSKQPEQKALIKCSVEGPYGNGASLQHYDTVSYLSGGNGIPGPFASALQLSHTAKEQNIKLYWVIRHWKSIEWFYEELRSLESTSVQPIVYVTAFDTPLDKAFFENVANSDESLEVLNPEKVEEKENEKELGDENAAQLMKSLPFVEFRSGRPNLEAIVQSDIADSRGSIAFVACGHSDFVDTSRRVVIQSLENGKRVDFYDTMELW